MAMARPWGGGRRTCESSLSLDINAWHSGGYLTPGKIFSWEWRYRGSRSSSLVAHTDQGAVVLVFARPCGPGGEWAVVKQRIPLRWTPCHFGGRRPWFVCSGVAGDERCGRRVGKLYAAGSLFACRRCYGLAYQSQHEAPRGRNIRRAQEIRLRLGGSASLIDPFPGKPKGMHWSTYARLHERAERAMYRSMQRLPARLRRHCS
jgi:hypothetical protein